VRTDSLTSLYNCCRPKPSTLNPQPSTPQVRTDSLSFLYNCCMVDVVRDALVEHSGVGVLATIASSQTSQVCTMLSFLTHFCTTDFSTWPQGSETEICLSLLSMLSTVSDKARQALFDIGGTSMLLDCVTPSQVCTAHPFLGPLFQHWRHVSMLLVRDAPFPKLHRASIFGRLFVPLIGYGIPGVCSPESGWRRRRRRWWECGQFNGADC